MYNQECTKTLSVCNCINYIVNNPGARGGDTHGHNVNYIVNDPGEREGTQCDAYQISCCDRIIDYCITEKGGRGPKM